jgi:hypothetical protein
MHLYTKSDDELHYSYETTEETENYLEYNLPSYNFTPQRWDKTFINDADFAIVLMIDDMLKEKKVKSAISQERKWAKSGATKLMKDSDIRQSNIRKYRNAEIYKMVNKDTAEFSNLQKILIKHFCGKYILFSVFCNSPGISLMRHDLIRKLNRIKNNKDNIDEYIGFLASFYEDVKRNNDFHTKKFKESLLYIRAFKNDNFNFIFDKIGEMSDKIYNYLQVHNIKTIEDLNKLLEKINNIDDYFFDKYALDSNTLYILGNFSQPDAVARTLATCYVSPMEVNKNTKSIEKIEKIISEEFKI